MKTNLPKIVAIAWLFMTGTAQALQPELIYGFQWRQIGTSARLVQGSDGDFYGTTSYGGSNGFGTVFRVTTGGALTTLVAFSQTNGAHPAAELVMGHDGNFYGTTAWGGSSNYGTVFRVTTGGLLTSLVSFTGTNGRNPSAGLVLGNDDNLYGTAGGGGGSGDHGTIFKVATNGVLTTLVSFDYAQVANPNGAYPQASLVLGDDGAFYGTTVWGGSSDLGTVFRVTSTGMLSTLVSFALPNGGRSYAALVLGNDGNFYGTTAYGGSNGRGTVFKVTTNGVLTTLISFNGDNGAEPYAALVLGNDGAFYGTTYVGGSTGHGTVFRVTSIGVLTTLVSFNGDNGYYPETGLVVGRDGNFYGTTYGGGPGGGGTIFRLVISAFTSVARQPGGSLLLTGTGPAHGGYRLWASADLSLPFASWTLLTSASFDSNGNFSYTDAGAATNPSRFYQLSVP